MARGNSITFVNNYFLRRSGKYLGDDPNPEFAAHFQLNENRMLQGMLMTCFLLGYGFSALLLTPVIESRWHYRQGLLSSIAIWALVCAISPLLGSLLGMLIARIVLGVAEGPLFSLKTRFINDNFAADEIGKPNALTALGVSLGLAVGFRWSLG